jgi:hypothetical protein
MSAEELEKMTYDLGVQKLAFEKQEAENERQIEGAKLASEQEIERNKLDLEKRKAKWAVISVFVTAFSILGSVTVAGLTIVESHRLQNQAAETQFALKAADLVLQSDDPVVNQDKASRFQELVPDRVPAKWGENYNANDHVSENDEFKREVAKLLTEHPDRFDQIIATYRTLFANDKTVQAFLDRLTAAGDPSHGVHKEGSH